MDSLIKLVLMIIILYILIFTIFTFVITNYIVKPYFPKESLKKLYIITAVLLYIIYIIVSTFITKYKEYKLKTLYTIIPYGELTESQKKNIFSQDQLDMIIDIRKTNPDYDPEENILKTDLTQEQKLKYKDFL